MTKPLRVIQCGTGIAGALALKAILGRDYLRLAGLLVHSAANDGRDAGSFVSAEPCGVTATRSVADLVATEADIVLYMLLVPSLDDICLFLASGKNVVSTAGFMFPRWNNPDADRRLRAACEAGASSFYVTGVNPGFVDGVLPLTLSMLSQDWSRIEIDEYADCSSYPSAPMLFDVMGFGHTPAEIAGGRAADMSVMTDFFSASVAALGHELGVAFDAVTQSREFALAPEPLELPVGRIRAGGVAGQRWRWAGIKDGVERIVQQTYWILAFDLAEGWPTAGEMGGDTLWTVTIHGTPSLRCTFEARESFTGAKSNVNPAGAATAMAAVNSLHAVASAKPGLLISADLPQPRWRGKLA